MPRHRHIFICGLHRSGTSLLHEYLRTHPEISGFHNTGVPEDEGQHLQSVYPTARVFGGPGKFGFDPESFMDEHHPLATPENAARLFGEWRRHWDLSRPLLVEKSPPNLVRTRFLQKLFPGSYFLVIVRHPIAVAMATQKWSQTGALSLIDHSLLCYRRLLDDLPHLENVHLIRYADLVTDPASILGEVFAWLGLDAHDGWEPPRTGENEKYFAEFEQQGWVPAGEEGIAVFREFEEQLAVFGYSLGRHKVLPWVPLFGQT